MNRNKMDELQFFLNYTEARGDFTIGKIFRILEKLSNVKELNQRVHFHRSRVQVEFVKFIGQQCSSIFRNKSSFLSFKSEIFIL